jgi:hypothetical protein
VNSIHRLDRFLLRGGAALALALALASGVGTAAAQVDPAAPDTVITDGPPPEFSYDAIFEFTGSDDTTPAENLTFECAVVNFVDWAPCVSPHTVSGLPVGDHIFAVRAIDADGNVDASPAIWSWTLVPLCGGFNTPTIWVDYNGIIRGGPNSGQFVTPDASGTLLVINGTAGNDIIFGTAANPFDDNPFNGDLINGLGGNDLICGGLGADTIRGGAGRDTLYGNFGNDTLEGEGDNDSLFGGEQNDILRGGTGADQLNLGSGSDLAEGGPGNDTFNGGIPLNGPEPDIFDGGTGTDSASNVEVGLDTTSSVETVIPTRQPPTR